MERVKQHLNERIYYTEQVSNEPGIFIFSTKLHVIYTTCGVSSLLKKKIMVSVSFLLDLYYYYFQFKCAITGQYLEKYSTSV